MLYRENPPCPPLATDNYPHMPPWLWSMSEVGEEDAIDGNAGFKALESSPKSCSTGFAVVFPAKKAAQARQHPDCFAHGWFFDGQVRCFVHQYVEGLPFGLLKENW